MNAIARPAPLPFTLDGLAPYHVVPQFMAEAPVLRQAIDRHFQDPYKAGPEHQVWNYWYVPQSYTYLRTSPEKVIERTLVDRFVDRLRWFSMTWLGLDTVTWPNLSLYVEGCGQTLHNDSRNGAFGYVYSLTNWDTRRFSGGETLVFREQDYWASGRFRESGAGTSFYENIPSLFNQLLLFDDRLIHGVPQVRGTNDPREGRVVLHGHLQAKGPCVSGPLAQLSQSQGLEPLAEVLEKARALVSREPGRYHGFVTCAVEVAPDGSVARVQRLIQRVLGSSGPQDQVAAIDQWEAMLRQLRFAPQPQPSRITLPLFFE